MRGLSTERISLGGALRIYALCLAPARPFNPTTFLRRPALDCFSLYGQGVAKAFVRGELSNPEFDSLMTGRLYDPERWGACSQAARAFGGHQLVSAFLGM